MSNEKQDVYTRVTAKIAAALEQGVRPWIKPWSVQHTAGRITRPLRHSGEPYRGINVLMQFKYWNEVDFYSAPLISAGRTYDCAITRSNKGFL